MRPFHEFAGNIPGTASGGRELFSDLRGGIPTFVMPPAQEMVRTGAYNGLTTSK